MATVKEVTGYAKDTLRNYTANNKPLSRGGDLYARGRGVALSKCMKSFADKGKLAPVLDYVDNVIFEMTEEEKNTLYYRVNEITKRKHRRTH